MAEDKITAAETANEGAKKSENIVELARPYGFEGKEYGEIDLTGLHLSDTPHCMGFHAS